MRPHTLARLQELATEASRYVKSRVEPLQLAALIIECHLAPSGRTQGAQNPLRGFAKFRGKVAWEGNLDELRRNRLESSAAPGDASGLDLVRDLVGSVTGPPDLSHGSRNSARGSQGSDRKQKRPRRGRQSRRT